MGDVVVVDGEPMGDAADANVAVLELVLSVVPPPPPLPPPLDPLLVIVVAISAVCGCSGNGIRSTGASVGAILALLPGTERMSHKSLTVDVSRAPLILLLPLVVLPLLLVLLPPPPSSGLALGDDGAAAPPLPFAELAFLTLPSEKLKWSECRVCVF